MFREMGMQFWMARAQAVLARGSTLPGPPYFSGGVTPAGRGTCATFRVIDTRL